MNFQDLILELSRFWANHGCVLTQPSDQQVGAGTFNPMTFFRVLGPEDWKVAYPQSSRRPTDGRYGDNPNRLYMHHQYQVIQKPSPDNIQDLYLESLKAVGIDYCKHDIRFVVFPTIGYMTFLYISSVKPTNRFCVGGM